MRIASCFCFIQSIDRPKNFSFDGGVELFSVLLAPLHFCSTENHDNVSLQSKELDVFDVTAHGYFSVLVLVH